ncbi:MAG TPA: phosphatase PAP2 family protein [Eggerthellaceae bacterium]|nr:phosphatase PAP2 family protein [Eggerthellaceae bacterium]
MKSSFTFTRLKDIVLKRKRILIIGACIILFIELLDDVLEGDLMTLDLLAKAFFVENLRADWLTPIMESISALATPVSLLVLLLIIVAFAPGKRPGMFCTVNLVLVVLLNVLLKELVQRPRPENINLVVETGFSFPSGHSMVAMAFFGLLVWLVWHYEKDRTLRLACCAGFLLIILLIGISRIYLGVHYASDVLAGFCISLAWLAMYTSVAAPFLLQEAEEKAD